MSGSYFIRLYCARPLRGAAGRSVRSARRRLPARAVGNGNSPTTRPTKAVAFARTMPLDTARAEEENHGATQPLAESSPKFCFRLRAAQCEPAIGATKVSRAQVELSTRLPRLRS